MDIEGVVEQTGFHDAELTAMRMRGDRVRLRFEDVRVDPERREHHLVAVEVEWGGVREVTRDSGAAGTLRLEDEAPDVMRFERSGDTAPLPPGRVFYTARTNRTCVYGFVFDVFDRTVERREPGLP